MPMDRESAKKLVLYTAGLFPGITPEQAGLLQELLLPYDYAVAERAIKEHKKTREFIDYSQLRQGLYAEKSRAEKAKGRQSRERVIDWLRIQHAGKVAGKGDLEALLHHFGGTVEDLRRDLSGEPLAEALKLVRGHALMAFQQIGLTDEDAKAATADCLGEAVPAGAGRLQ